MEQIKAAAFLTVDEVARTLRVSAETVRRRCREGSMAHRRLGRTGRAIRIPASVLDGAEDAARGSSCSPAAVAGR